MASMNGLSLGRPSDNMDPEDARALRSYLYQMQEQLQYVLTNLDTENMSDTLSPALCALLLTVRRKQAEFHLGRIGRRDAIRLLIINSEVVNLEVMKRIHLDGSPGARAVSQMRRAVQGAQKRV